MVLRLHEGDAISTSKTWPSCRGNLFMLSKKMLTSFPKLRIRSVFAVPKHFGGILNLGLPSPEEEEETGSDSRSKKRNSLLVAGRESVA